MTHVDLPLAQQLPGITTPEAHNRVRKAALIAFDLYWVLGAGLSPANARGISSAIIASGADRIQINRPSGHASEDAVRTLLQVMLEVRDRQGAPSAAVGPHPGPLPTAADALPYAGAHELHARLRKAVIMAFDLFWRVAQTWAPDQADQLTSAQIREAADQTDQHAPSGAPTEYAVRQLLRAMLSIRGTGSAPAAATTLSVPQLTDLINSGSANTIVVLVQSPAA